MLNQLLAIKKRREQSARSNLTKATARQQQQELEKIRLQQQQKTLREEWHESNQQQHQVAEHEFKTVQNALNVYYLQDCQINEQNNQVGQKLAELESQKSQYRTLIERARVEQEKLNWLLEQKP